MNVETLNRHTQLSRVREARGDGSFECALQRSIIQNNHRVLPAQLGRETNKATSCLFGHDFSGRRRSGEHDEVGVVDDGGAKLWPIANDDLEETFGKTRLIEQVKG